MADEARRGEARRGKARTGLDGPGAARLTRRGWARRGGARRGRARPGKARLTRHVWETTIHNKTKERTMTEIQKRFVIGLEKKGRITAHAVLDAARPASSPIHDCFDWNDSEAAEKWRLEQARELIRRVKIELVYQEVSVRTVKYVADPASSDGYTDIVKAREPSLSEIMSAEWRNVLALAKRAQSIATARGDRMPAGYLDRCAETVALIETMTEL